MRRLILLASLALAVGGLVPGSALPAAGGSKLPVQGSHSGYGTWNLLTGQFQVASTGPISHFGFTTVDQDVQAVPTGPNTTIWFGTWTATAANGDQMLGTATGTTVFTDAVHSTSQGIYTSTGGTGRFADASLSLDTTGPHTIVSVEGTTATFFFEVTLVGQLSY